MYNEFEQLKKKVYVAKRKKKKYKFLRYIAKFIETRRKLIYAHINLRQLQTVSNM